MTDPPQEGRSPALEDEWEQDHHAVVTRVKWHLLLLALGALLLGSAAPALDSISSDSGAPVEVSAVNRIGQQGASHSVMTLRDHVFLLFLGVVVGAAFGGAQKWAGFEIDRNRRHHRAVAQLEYILGRQFHRLAMNASRAERLRDTLRAGELGSMFPALHRPDDSPCIELLNTGLINAILRVDERLEVIDHNLESLRVTYEKLRDQFSANPESKELRHVYEQNAGPIADEYDALRQMMEETRAELSRSLAWLKILGTRDKPGLRRFLLGRSRKSPDVSDEEIEAMVKDMARLATEPQRFRQQVGEGAS